MPPATLFLLVTGCRALAKVKASTKKLAAVDIFGSCSVICADKTGTLTQGKMVLVSVACRTAGGHQSTFVPFPQQGVEPRGDIYREQDLTGCRRDALSRHYFSVDSSSSTHSDIPAAARAVSGASLGSQCRGSHLDFGDLEGQRVMQDIPSLDARERAMSNTALLAGFLSSPSADVFWDDYPADGGPARWVGKGNSSEVAFVVAARKARLGTQQQKMFPRLIDVEVPFASSRRMAATVHQLDSSSRFGHIQCEESFSHVAIIKGAPDAIMSYNGNSLLWSSDTNRLEFGDLDARESEWIRTHNEDMSNRALRVFMVAVRQLRQVDVERLKTLDASQRLEFLLGIGIHPKQSPAFLCLSGIKDPPRAEARSAVQKAQQAGVRVVMITGDQKLTASAVASDLGILRQSSPERCQNCTELNIAGDEMSEEDLDTIVQNTDVWARAAPADKVEPNYLINYIQYIHIIYMYNILNVIN